MYNPPICYPEYPSSRTKRYSTDSMTESTSPHNEDAGRDPSQSGGETAGNPPEYSQIYNVVYTTAAAAAPAGYYFNGVCAPNALANGQGSTEPRRIKKKRRRKISKSATHDGTTSSDDCESSDEAVTQVENRVCSDRRNEKSESPAPSAAAESKAPPAEDEAEDATNTCSDDAASQASSNQEEEEEEDAPSKFNLNAEEFIPRAYRNAPPDRTNLQFVNIHPNFIPISLLSPLSELPPPPPPPPPPHPAFLPPGIPLNFMPADPKLLPLNFYVPKPTAENPPALAAAAAKQNEDGKKEKGEKECKEEAAVVVVAPYKNNIDIAKIVSKLEEAAKEQRLHENKRNGLRYYNKFGGKGGSQRQRFSSETRPKFRPGTKKDEESRNPANYSDTLKKVSPSPSTKTICPRYNRHVERSTTAAKPPCSASAPEKERASQKSLNQWISVSNRKKRKHKSTDELCDDATPLSPPPTPQMSPPLLPPSPPPSPPPVVMTEQIETPPPAPNQEPSASKKKSKKGTQKPLMKRVIIVDVAPPEPVATEEAAPKKPLELLDESTAVPTPEKKKTKKKKKPPPPPTATIVKTPTGSLNALNTSATDDTYDFLLDTSVLEEKTNLEISEELDKMIQKGMYSNLEEKIKSMSVSPVSDDFFRSISFKRPADVTANNFTALLKNTGRILGSIRPPVVEEHDDVDVVPPLPSTSKTGDFLELNAKSSGKLKNKSKKELKVEDESVEEVKKTLYPITQAVKEWMTKTRENTPEVELLKSPDTIYREFIEDEEKEEEDESKNAAVGNPFPPVEGGVADEIVVFESESWEKGADDRIERGEDVLEIYEKIKRNPKHGNFPYRAICCNLM